MSHLFTENHKKLKKAMSLLQEVHSTSVWNKEVDTTFHNAFSILRELEEQASDNTLYRCDD